MIRCQFIFQPGTYDDDFHRLDGQIDEHARRLPGFDRVEKWISPEAGAVNAIYYLADIETVRQLVRSRSTAGGKSLAGAGAFHQARSMTSSDVWDNDTARRYDDPSSSMFSPEVLVPTVDFLAGLAGDGPALEFAIGTGRVAVPLSARGVAVTGIELSEPMVEQLRRRVSAAELPVAVGDMATTRVAGDFSLVYLVFNALGNLRTQEEQVGCFRNAARHLAPGGHFVIELWVPGIRRFPPGQTAVPFEVTERHTGVDTYDMATQQGTSHHYSRQEDGTYRYSTSNFRYVWPAECDLMARLAGLQPAGRWAHWDRSPFTADSNSHVSVWRRPAPN